MPAGCINDLTSTGAYIRVAPGFMRNVLYPRKIARYVVGQELKSLLQSESVIQRDRSYNDPDAMSLEHGDALSAEWKAAFSRNSEAKPKTDVPTIEVFEQTFH
jgi:ribosomal protein L9